MTRILGLRVGEACWLFIVAVGLASEAITGIRGEPLLSPTIRMDARLWLTWAAVWGTLLGHFFGPGLAWAPDAGPWITIGVALAFLAFDGWRRLYRPELLSPEVVFVTALVMILFGWVFWNQGVPKA